MKIIMDFFGRDGGIRKGWRKEKEKEIVYLTCTMVTNLSINWQGDDSRLVLGIFYFCEIYMEVNIVKLGFIDTLLAVSQFRTLVGNAR